MKTKIIVAAFAMIMATPLAACAKQDTGNALDNNVTVIDEAGGNLAEDPAATNFTVDGNETVVPPDTATANAN
jgi:hypothetical protein